ncbi:DUF6371 domain-containing protein [Psychroserpens burtonensis]|uniref:DUF6371 domain-containing protein n=1 Tax=Psychroserpens burtonensis TaxID=49278 RepID=UPI0012F94F6E|nr:DUF6371 domain-containing protein [Psychroserpens burtonensis]
MLQKIENRLEFNSKRNKGLITPCCDKLNRDGKFVNYKGYPDNYGYCHSCGTSTTPTQVYEDENGTPYYWNKSTNAFEETVVHSTNNVLQNCHTNNDYCNTIKSKITKYIDFKVVSDLENNEIDNNLLLYLQTMHDNDVVDRVKKMYHIGTSENGGTVFCSINKDGKVQKLKIVYYSKVGKRTDYFKVPYKNEDGYYSCLFGEHLLCENTKPIILIESEKTAIVCSILLPNYTWLSYGGINGLTDEKIKVLEGEKVTIVPDISENAVAIMKKKLPNLKRLGVEANIWDMTEGKTDKQLKIEGIYNCDLEDLLSSTINNKK